MTQVRIDVFDAAGNRVGAGPVTTAKSVSVTREMDGAGKFSVSVEGDDYDALNTLTNERRIKIWVWNTPNSPKRLLGSGIVRSFGWRKDQSGGYLTISGPDILDELKRKNVWMAWQRNNENVGSIVSDLNALVSGWVVDTAGLAGLEPLSIRLDGASVLKGYQAVVEQRGVHFRLATDSKTVEFGALGQDTGLIITGGMSRIADELYQNENVALIDRIEIMYQTEAVANRIVVFGPGDFEAALTLKHSTRTTPYTIEEMAVNGQALYYLEDAASIAAFGAIEKVYQANQVAALSNSPEDLLNASNALYDQAAASLERMAVQQEVYKVTALKTEMTLRPGDKVRLEFMGYAVDNDGNPVRWVNLRGDYWVVAVTERVETEGGSAVDLEISNIDVQYKNEAQHVLGEIEALKVRNTVVKPYLSKDTISPPAEAIDPDHDVIFPLKFGDYTAKINQVVFRLNTRPFRSTAKSVATSSSTTESGGGSVQSSAAGGDHYHRVAAITSISGFPGTSPRPYLARVSSGGATLYIKVEANADSDWWTDGASGSHTHSFSIPSHVHLLPDFSLEYGISDDNQTPENIRVYVDNVEVAGGPFAPSGGNFSVDLDITSYFDEVNFQGAHEIKVTCDDGQGLVIGQIEVRETIQSIKAIPA